MSRWSLIEAIQARRARERGGDFQEGPRRVAMVYPSPYRVGMSSLGFQWIHRVLSDAGFAVERAFLPDDVDEWRKARAPLLTYETLTPVGEFPIIGVSLAYELELAGLFEVLELSGIPPLREQRDDSHPRVILGGPITFSNPLPAAPFVDAMLLGEAEEVVAAAVDASFTRDRSGWLDVVAGLPGGYVPERHGVMLPPVAKATDALLPARSHILTPDTELRDMFLIEGERGCHRQCTFCVMRRSTNGGMRLVTPERILSFIPEGAKRVGLVGAAISDHPKLVPLLEQIVASGREVGVSSLRADRIALKPRIAEVLRAGGYKTLTVASDAASQRLRRTIAKGTTEKHLLACAELAAKYRYKTLKIYMMVGVPDENEADLDELLRFTRELAKVHNVSLGIAPFVAKRNTPLDGEPFAGIPEVERRLKRLHKGLRGTRGEVRPTSARWAWAEYMLAQHGPGGGLAAYEAWKAGGKFSDYKRAFKALDASDFRPWVAATPPPEPPTSGPGRRTTSPA